MTEEQIPNHLIMAELEEQLHSKTSELVVANARIRARDEKIVNMQADIDRLRHRVDEE